MWPCWPLLQAASCNVPLAMQMLLAVPAGIHFNPLLYSILNLDDEANTKQFGVVLGINVAIAALALPAALLLRNAPPSLPCPSAEQPFQAHLNEGHSYSAPQSSPSIAISPQRSQSTPLSGGLSAQRDLSAQRARRGQGCERRGLPTDLRRLLQTPSFLLLLVAFSLTMSAFSTFYLFMEEFLDRAPSATGVNLYKVIASIGAVAFTAGAYPH
jgi:hypothetical protein